MNDEQLLRSVQEGDTGALERLVRDLSPTVYAYLSGMLGDPDEAGDALQETFVRVARSIGRYDGVQDPESWVLGIARRVAADMRPTPSAPPGDIGSEPDPATWARRALRALELEHRELLVCREVLGWDVERIARTLEQPHESIAARLHTAREELVSGMQERV